MPKRPNITTHARERYIERVRPQHQGGEAAVLARVFSRSILIPYKYGNPRWGRTSKSRLESGTQYRLSGASVLICRQTRVLTVLRASPDDLATVLAWLLTGLWLEGETSPEGAEC